MFHVKQEQIDFYQDNGFVQFDQILSSDELAELRGYVDEMMAVEGELSFQRQKDDVYYKVLNQKVNSWRDSAGMAKYSLHPRFAEIALQISKLKGIRLFHDHILLKMPGDSKPTSWHQDLPFWPMKGTGALSIWIALDDVDENNGCMMFIPKSNKLGKLKAIDLAEPEDIFSYLNKGEVEGNKPVIVRMKAGSCTLHNGLTFHYAHANTTDKPRRVLAIIYMPDGTTYSDHSDHLVTKGFGFKNDDLIQGRFFPVLANL